LSTNIPWRVDNGDCHLIVLLGFENEGRSYA